MPARPRFRLAALSRLFLLLLLAGTGSLPVAAAPSSYEVVDLSGSAYVATGGIAFTRDAIKIATPAGRREIPASEVDWYTTFWRNIRAASTNVIVFAPGSILLFDGIELKDGHVVLSVAEGGTVTLAESLIEFEASVREGAMVKLAGGASPSVQVARGAGGAWTPDGGGPPQETAGSRRRPSVASRARAGSLGAPPMAAGADMVEMGDGPVMAGELAEDPGYIDPAQDLTEPARPSSRSPFPRRSPFGQPNGTESPGGNGGNGGDEQSSGQAIVTISTDYVGPMAGVHVQLQYPPNLQVVEPVTFTGFAANWMAQPNTQVPGQIIIAGASPGSNVGGGEFLRVTFVWTGSPPSRQLFRIAQLRATSEGGEDVTEFRTTMDVQISP